MTALGYLHSLAALLALVGRTAVLPMSKGTRRNMRAGSIYLLYMIVLNVSALAAYRITGGFGGFHVKALLSLATLTLGIGLIRRGGRAAVHRHACLMLWSCPGPVAAAVSEFATRTPGRTASAGVLGISPGLRRGRRGGPHARGRGWLRLVSCPRAAELR